MGQIGIGVDNLDNNRPAWCNFKPAQKLTATGQRWRQGAKRRNFKPASRPSSPQPHNPVTRVLFQAEPPSWPTQPEKRVRKESDIKVSSRAPSWLSQRRTHTKSFEALDISNRAPFLADTTRRIEAGKRACKFQAKPSPLLANATTAIEAISNGSAFQAVGPVLPDATTPAGICHCL